MNNPALDKLFFGAAMCPPGRPDGHVARDENCAAAVQKTGKKAVPIASAEVAKMTQCADASGHGELGAHRVRMSRDSKDLPADCGIQGERQMRRYVRLSKLISELQLAIEEKRLSVSVGENLSYLSRKNQRTIFRFFFERHPQKISKETAQRIRKMAAKPLTQKMLLMLFPKMGFSEVEISMDLIGRHFPADATPEQVEQTIVVAVKSYFEKGGKDG